MNSRTEVALAPRSRSKAPAASLTSEEAGAMATPPRTADKEGRRAVGRASPGVLLTGSTDVKDTALL